MSTHTCALCHLVFRYQTELEAHIRQDHADDRHRPEAEAHRTAAAPAEPAVTTARGR